MIKLTTEQVKLAEQLLLTVKNKEMNVEYNELGDRIEPKMHWRQVAKNIGAISELCYQLGLPFLSAKVISKGKNEAGIGLYNLYKQYFPEAVELNPSQVFKEECKKIRECGEWYKLAEYLHIDIDLPKQDINMNNTFKQSIRILPMSNTEEFEGVSIEDIQNDYFLGELINNTKGIYYFRKSGIIAPKGSLILFQFDNMIVASGNLLGVEKFDTPVEGQYYGAFEFDVNSIKVFQPITLAEINSIDCNITAFSQVKQEINSQFKSDIEELIKSKQNAIIPDEILRENYEGLIEGAKRKIIVNAYERNFKARQACIEHYGSTCVICGFDFAKFYGREFQGKIHVHHVKPLFEINESYEVDPIKDLRPVCPNCHLALHSKFDGKIYDIDELKSKIKK